jgi:hypothetical protein
MENSSVFVGDWIANGFEQSQNGVIGFLGRMRCGMFRLRQRLQVFA